LNIEIWVQENAGAAAYATNEVYQQAGASLHSRSEILQDAQIIFSILPHTNDDLQIIKTGTVVIGVYQPLYNYAEMQLWANKNLITFNLDTIPRTTRAQSMDVLSSQANIAGYNAVLLAAANYGRYFPMFITAAGSIPPAKVLVKEEVMSLGAKFVEVEGAADASKAGGYAVEQSAEYQQKQQQRLAEAAKKADHIITTAQIPG
jgi:NAD(P) transhydrogenase subunit alpha